MKSADDNARYLDHSHWGCSSVFLTDDRGRPVKILRAGTPVLSMPAKERGHIEYQTLAEQGVHCFFDGDDAPRPNFYAVPMLNVFAWDECGGFWGTKGALADLDDLNAPVYHVDRRLCVTKVADHLRAFLMPPETIRKRAFSGIPTGEITLYSSASEAHQALNFLVPPDCDGGS